MNNNIRKVKNNINQKFYKNKKFKENNKNNTDMKKKKATITTTINETRTATTAGTT